MNSLVANYLVRMHVTTHVTASLMTRLPVPRPSAKQPEFRQLVTLAKRLAANGVSEESADYAQLNAIAAHLYGLTVDQYTHILETFPLVSQPQRDLCLSAFSRLNIAHGSTETQNH